MQSTHRHTGVHEQVAAPRIVYIGSSASHVRDMLCFVPPRLELVTTDFAAAVVAVAFMYLCCTTSCHYPEELAG